MCVACKRLRRFEMHGSKKPIFTTPLIAAIASLPRLNVLVLKQAKCIGAYATHAIRSCSIAALTQRVVSKLRSLELLNVGSVEEQKQLRVLCAKYPKQLTAKIE